MAFEKVGYDIRYQIFRQLIPNLEIHYPHSESLAGERFQNSAVTKPNLRYGIVLANKQYSQEFLEFVYKHATFFFPVKQRNTADFRQWPITLCVLQNIQFCRFVDATESKGAWSLPKEIHLPLISTLLPSLRRMELEVFVNPNVVEDEEGMRRDTSGSNPSVLRSVVTEIPCRHLADSDPLEASYVW